ncbi:hypothetical protein [Mycolicibacterium sp. GESEQ-9]|uniref:hypothetical protein n=1 Tax=Mycolicibacterium sp. GESEQ-9 TaxID=2812656 RepID=UPI001B334185|nr:hypothetical protein [Mycolicibacterium sp. GESEQ-9]
MGTAKLPVRSASWPVWCGRRSDAPPRRVWCSSFVCAVCTHVLARDYSAQFALAIGFLALNTGTLALSLT